MARHDYILSVQAQTAQAEKSLQRVSGKIAMMSGAVGKGAPPIERLSKSLLGIGAALVGTVGKVFVPTRSLSMALLGVGGNLAKLSGDAKKGAVSADQLSAAFIGLDLTLAGTAATVAFVGGAVETAMFRSRVAIESVGGSAGDLVAKFNAIGRSATELLPVAAKFAGFMVAGDQLEGVTEVARKMGRVLGITSQESGAALGEIGARARLKTAPDFEKLASGIVAADRAFSGISGSTIEMLRASAPLASNIGIQAGALIGFKVAAQRAGVGADAANKAISTMVEQFRFGPEVAAGMAQGLGMTSDQVEKFMAADPTDQFQMMALSMRNLTGNAEQNALVLETLFGITRTEATAMLTMAKDTDAVNKTMMQFRREVKAGTALSKSAAEKGRTLSEAMHNLWDSVKALGEGTGKWLSPILTGLVDILSTVIGWIGKIPSPVRAATIAVLGLYGAISVLNRGIATFHGIRALFSAASIVTAGEAAVGAATSIGKAAIAAEGAAAAATGAGEAAVVSAGKWGLLGRALGGIRGLAAGLIPGLGALAGASVLTLAAVGVAALGEALVVGHMIKRAGEMIEDNWGEIEMAASNAWAWVKSAAGKVGDFFAGVANGIGSFFGFISSAIGSVGDTLFGSSMLHIKEGVAEVMPSLRRVEGAFNSVGRAAGRVAIEGPIPEDMRVRVEEPIGRIGAGRFSGLSAVSEGRQAFGGPAGSGPGREERASVGRPSAGAEGGGAGGTVRIVVPVTVKLDQDVIARAVSEYEMTVGRERHMNAPAEPLRATGR